jgi:hypothetical protein
MDHRTHYGSKKAPQTQICVKTRTDLILRGTSSKDESQVVDGICVTGEDKEIVKSHSSWCSRSLKENDMTLEHLLMPMYYYGYVIVASWLILMAVWVVGNFTAKPDVSSRPRIVRWLWQLPLLGLLIYVLRNPYDDVTVLERAFFNFGPAVDWVGAFVTVVGVVFAIWARYRLGRKTGAQIRKKILCW